MKARKNKRNKYIKPELSVCKEGKFWKIWLVRIIEVGNKTETKTSMNTLIKIFGLGKLTNSEVSDNPITSAKKLLIIFNEIGG